MRGARAVHHQHREGCVSLSRCSRPGSLEEVKVDARIKFRQHDSSTIFFLRQISFLRQI